VEIGFGNGSFLVERAQREPEANFIGLEVYRKGIRKAIKRIERAGIKNIRLLRLEAAASLPKLFTEGEINEVYINFPDPWPKRRHRKRRLINSSFVAMLYTLLNDKGKVFIATDYQEYAQEIEKFFCSHGGFRSINQYFPEHTPTKYEQEGIRKRVPIYYLGWEKLP
jgi:tRNA (guanine-N7-)-methyltransferase